MLKHKYKLINENDPNIFIEFEVDYEQEDPCSIALEKLGWILVAAKNEEEFTE